MTDREKLLGVIANYNVVFPEDRVLNALNDIAKLPETTDVEIARRLGIFQHQLWMKRGAEFGSIDEMHMIQMGL